MPTPDEIAKHVEEMMTPTLQALAQQIDGQLPENWGFGLLLFEYGGPNKPLLWVSNADLQDMVGTMKEFIERYETRKGQEDADTG